MTEYERGFNEGFAAALARLDRAPGNSVGVPTRDISVAKCIPVRVRADQLRFLLEYSAAVGCSLAAAMRNLIDQTIKARANERQSEKHV